MKSVRYTTDASTCDNVACCMYCSVFIKIWLHMSASLQTSLVDHSLIFLSSIISSTSTKSITAVLEMAVIRPQWQQLWKLPDFDGLTNASKVKLKILLNSVQLSPSASISQILNFWRRIKKDGTQLLMIKPIAILLEIFNVSLLWNFAKTADLSARYNEPRKSNKESRKKQNRSGLL